MLFIFSPISLLLKYTYSYLLWEQFCYFFGTCCTYCLRNKFLFENKVSPKHRQCGPLHQYLSLLCAKFSFLIRGYSEEMYLITVECTKFSDTWICAIVLGFLYLTELYLPYNNSISSSCCLMFNDRTIGL